MGTTQLVSYIFLAEFDIDVGPTLSKQFPLPAGMQELEQLIAELMLPEGVHDQSEDWTVFLLNQTPANSISPLFSEGDESAGPSNGDDKELLYVLNLVLSKRDSSVRRGGVVKAMAICTHYPYIQIFKPVLLIGLEDYFLDPSMDCLGRIYDALNAIDVSQAPVLSRSEKLIMRLSERTDIFAEKFSTNRRPISNPNSDAIAKDYAQSETFSVILNGSAAASNDSLARENRPASRLSSDTSVSESSSMKEWSEAGMTATVTESTAATTERETLASRQQARSSFDSRSVSDSLVGGAAPTSASHSSLPGQANVRDTHFFETSIAYKGFTLPIKLPLSTFSEEIGDYSLIQLIQTFSAPTSTVSGPLHPHLHTNGKLTHPVILMFNALVTQKRVIFLGHGKLAGHVANFVLAACALASGSGCVLRGFVERAFPYAHLSLYENVIKNVPGFIAGVTNPIFEQKDWWDVLCNIETGKITVHKDIEAAPMAPPVQPPLNLTSGILRSESGGNEDELNRLTQVPAVRGDFASKLDHADNIFMDDIITAISQHYGETIIRAWWADYVARFTRYAARYEESALGSTSIGYPSIPFSPGTLGSGTAFSDEVTAMKDLAANASRIDGWRRTRSYSYFVIDFQAHLENRAIRGFDVTYQLWRLRHAKNMSPAEVELMMRSFSVGVRTYEQIVELLAGLPPHHGGLLPLTFCLFHQQESVRDTTVDFLSTLREYDIGAHFLSNLNQFHRYAYVRLAQAREEQRAQQRGGLLHVPTTSISYTPSNHSQASLLGSA